MEAVRVFQAPDDEIVFFLVIVAADVDAVAVCANVPLDAREKDLSVREHHGALEAFGKKVTVYVVLDTGLLVLKLIRYLF